MEFSQYPVDGLTQIPVQAQMEWVAKVQMTQPPDYIPATHYSLNCTLIASEAFLPVWMGVGERGLEYSKTWRHAAASGIEVRLLYLGDWSQAEGLTIGMGAEGHGLVQPAVLLTGVVYDWALEPGGYHPVRKVLLVAQRDTQNVRGRWRVKPALQAGLPADLSFLKQGRCAGTVQSWRKA